MAESSNTTWIINLWSESKKIKIDGKREENNRGKGKNKLKKGKKERHTVRKKDGKKEENYKQ